MTIKPIMGCPQTVSGQARGQRRKQELLLNSSNRLHIIGGAQAGYLYSWINLLNSIVFSISFLTRGLLDSDLIEQHTNQRLKSGVGILSNFGKTQSELEASEKTEKVLNYASKKWQDVDSKLGDKLHE